MRSVWLAGLLVVCGCKHEGNAPTTPAPASGADLDALWRLAPEGASVGFVVSPRGVAMVERAAAAIQALLAAAPELAPARNALSQALTQGLGSSNLALAELGLTATKGFALFGGDPHHDDAMFVFPVADRARFLARVHGQRADDHDVIGNLRCKPVGERYICLERDQQFDRIGRGSLEATRRTAGARGDIELVTRGFPDPDSPTVALAAQLDRGALIVRGTVGGLPRSVTQWIGSPGAPRADPATMAGFGVIDLAPYAGLAPAEPVAPGVTVRDLARSISGPVTFDNAAGSDGFHIRIPLRDPAPAQALLQHCPALLGPLGATFNAGACHVAIPAFRMELDGRVEGNELRIGSRAPARRVAITPSPLATELAAGRWSFALYGRGSLLAITSAPAMHEILRRMLGEFPDAAALFRTLPWFSEVGFGAQKDGDAVHVIVGVRTAWANPDAVVQKLAAITAAQIRSGEAGVVARSIAHDAPDSPFAQDVKAGAGGMLAVLPIGVIPAIAVPAFMDYMRRSRRSEAELQLDKIGRNARRAYNENSEFPRGKAPLTPAAPCCQGPDHHCVTGAADWQRDAWQALDFEIDEPSLYQYSYESDGRTFTARAVGDLDCDGTSATYELRGTSENGTPKTELILPPPGVN